ncbi:antitoxin VapB family protein [Candidatus Woesearchaeota archaeon]|nr:antitoxin VapB family protein [Candidatus Woesearchaeota archaeon]
MATKTISIMEDVYEMISREKMGDESFSDLLRRKFRKKDLFAFAGSWKSMTDRDAEELSSEIRKVRKDMSKRFSSDMP